MSRPCRVVIADDHPFYRRGLVQALLEGGIDVIREEANGEAAIRAVTETSPDLVLMDLNMTGISGIDATRRIRELSPTTPVVMLSVSAEEEDVAAAIQAGAIGYVLKEAPPEEIVAAIREAVAGGIVVSARLAERLLPAVGPRRHERRSHRHSPGDRETAADGGA